MKLARILMVGLTCAVVPASVFAQDAEPGAGLASLLLRFFAADNPVVLAGNANPQFNHAAHFSSQPAARETLEQLNTGIASQLATFPLGSSSGGFTYTFDSNLGVFTRTSESFGPLFAERAMTLGKGKLTFGATHTRERFDTFEGLDLRSGDIQLFLRHEESGRNLFFEPDLIRADLRLDVQTQTTSVFAAFGLSDRFDVGIAVPFVETKLNARIGETVERLATASFPNAVIHQFEGGGAFREEVQSGSASGVGDILLRAKYRLRTTGTVGLAAGLDLRLPTGDDENLLGAGSTQTKVFLIASGSGGFAPHLNLGYTFSGGGSQAIGELPNELNYTAGFDAVASKRITVTGDFVGRVLLDANRVEQVDVPYSFTPFGGLPQTTVIKDYVTRKENTNLMFGAFGVKLNPGSGFLVSANVLFSLTQRGLQDRFIPVVGVDFSF